MPETNATATQRRASAAAATRRLSQTTGRRASNTNNRVYANSPNAAKKAPPMRFEIKPNDLFHDHITYVSDPAPKEQSRRQSLVNPVQRRGSTRHRSSAASGTTQSEDAKYTIIIRSPKKSSSSSAPSHITTKRVSLSVGNIIVSPSRKKRSDSNAMSPSMSPTQLPSGKCSRTKAAPTSTSNKVQSKPTPKHDAAKVHAVPHAPKQRVPITPMMVKRVLKNTRIIFEEDVTRSANTEVVPLMPEEHNNNNQLQIEQPYTTAPDSSLVHFIPEEQPQPKPPQPQPETTVCIGPSRQITPEMAVADQEAIMQMLKAQNTNTQETVDAAPVPAPAPPVSPPALLPPCPAVAPSSMTSLSVPVPAMLASQSIITSQPVYTITEGTAQTQFYPIDAVPEPTPMPCHDIAVAPCNHNEVVDVPTEMAATETVNVPVMMPTSATYVDAAAAPPMTNECINVTPVNPRLTMDDVPVEMIYENNNLIVSMFQAMPGPQEERLDETKLKEEEAKKKEENERKDNEKKENEKKENEKKENEKKENEKKENEKKENEKKEDEKTNTAAAAATAADEGAKDAAAANPSSDRKATELNRPANTEHAFEKKIQEEDEKRVKRVPRQAAHDTDARVRAANTTDTKNLPPPKQEEELQKQQPANAPAGADAPAKVSYSVRFRGKGWQTVLPNKKPLIQERLVADVTQAFGVEPAAVTDVNVEMRDVMYATFNVVHTKNDTEYLRSMKAKLKGHTFPQVCKLYENGEPRKAEGENKQNDTLAPQQEANGANNEGQIANEQYVQNEQFNVPDVNFISAVNKYGATCEYLQDQPQEQQIILDHNIDMNELIDYSKIISRDV